MNDTTPIDHGALPSGRFVLRIDPELHERLRVAAREEGVSLNEFCARTLRLPQARLPAVAAEIVARAAERYGNSLVGVVAFGSMPRGEAGTASDVDVLIVIGERIAIGRKSYGVWDRDPLWWDGRRVEPHLVHLPEAGARPSGLWAEVAVDGVVLFERGLELSTRLAALRREILAGRFVRHRVHGQPYWVETA